MQKTVNGLIIRNVGRAPIRQYVPKQRVNMATRVREPQQERSIEKKNKIVKAGYELFSEVGYYNTNTAEIAKRAGVSTGIVYGYFKDKRDILLDVLDIYIESVFSPILALMDGLKPPIDFESLAATVLEASIAMHKQNANIHEALHSMSSTDDTVASKFIALEDEITLKIAHKFESMGVDIANLNERIHFAMDIAQSFSHESVFDSHSYIDYTAMRSIVIKTLVGLFKD